MKHYKVIACKIMQRELAKVLLNCKNALDITMLDKGLHDTPESLKANIQEEINRVESGCDIHTTNIAGVHLDAILLGYGLCSNALVGIKSSKLPIIIPRAHDCTTLFMGSKEEYARYFKEVKGTFFYTQGWIESGSAMDEVLERKYQEFMEMYGDDEETVEYLMDIEKSYLKNYKSFTYINWPEMENPDAIALAKEQADKKNWDFFMYEGHEQLMSDFVNGNWNEEDFLILQPGEELQPSYDETIIRINKSLEL